MKKTFFGLLAVLVGFVLNAQLPQPFDAFPESYVPSGYLCSGNGTFKSPVHDGSSFAPVSVSQARDMLFQLVQSSIQEPVLPTVDELCELDRLLRLEEQVISVRLVNLFYHDLHEDAVANGWIAFQDGIAQDLTQGTVNPFQEKRAFQMMVDVGTYHPGDLLFQIPVDGIYSNTDEVIESIELDMDDGLGWQPVEPGQTFEIQYVNDVADRFLRLRAMVNGSFLESAIVLRSAGLGEIPALDTPPWESDDPAWPWRITGDAPMDYVRGNAYTLISDDIFDKPFVFVEGIDFGLQPAPQRNGDFGWAEFATGGGSEYPFLYNTPNLLDALVAEGYDVVLLDFEDGARDVLENAHLLKSLIRVINEIKVGDEEMIVAGASMGGVISRIALREMELAGENHCVRTWISLDAPHEGANIPLSIQHVLYFLKDHFQEASWFYTNQLLRPASRQLLIQQVPQMGSLHEELYDYLEAIGYPQFARSIGVANGSGNGVGMEFSNGQPLVDYECEVFGTTAAKFLFLSSPGDPYHDLSSPFSYVLNQTYFSESTACSGLDCFFDPPFILDVWESTTLIPANTVGLDNVPGGFRNTLYPLIESLNLKLEERLSVYGSPPCPVEIEEYIPNHAFIPTVSALGIDTPNYFENVLDLLENYPTATPFDRVFAPVGYNMQHSEINNDILSLVLEEVLDGETILPAVLNAGEGNEGLFNLALPQNHVLPSLSIESGGALYLNAFLPINAGEDPLDLPEFGAHFEARSGCDALIEIGAAGLMQIGDENGYSTASLTLMDGSRMDLFTEGTLRIHEGSELVIRSGAEVHLDGGALLLEGNCRIKIEEGGKLVVHSDEPIELSGIEARIDIYGQISIEETECNVVGTGGEGGKLRFFNHEQNVIGTTESFLKVVGTGTNDKMIEVLPGAAFWTSPQFGKVEVIEAMIFVSEEAKFTVGGDVRMHRVKLQGAENNMGLRCYASTLIKEGFVSGMDILAFPGQHLFRFKESTAEKSLFHVNSGGYRLENSLFDNAAVRSEGLFYNAIIEQCAFQNVSDYYDAVFDESDVTCFIKESTFQNCEIAAAKLGGELRLRCSEFDDCEKAVFGGMYTHINLSTLTGAGYNRFSQNGVHIEGYGLSSLAIQDGYNQFLQYGESMIEGSIFGACNDECEAILNGGGNMWFYGVPTQWDVELQMIDPTCDLQSPLELLDGCDIKVFDKNPQSVVVCGAFDLSGDKPMASLEKLNLEEVLVNSVSFNGVPIEQAIQHAIWKHTWYDLEGNDDLAIDLLHEVLTAQYNEDSHELRWLLSRTEHILRSFVLESAALGGYSFSTLENEFPSTLLKNVQALNKLTPDNMSSSLYHHGFGLEAAKAQLFYAHCRHSEALEILDRTDDCEVDAHEQVQLNSRFQRVYNQMQFEDMLEASFDTDSLLIGPSDLSLPEPQPADIDQVVFGAIILSPEEIFYPSCGNQITRAELGQEGVTGQYGVYPNPASTAVRVVMTPSERVRTLRCYSSMGQLLYEGMIAPGTKAFVWEVTDIAPGWYQLQVWENGDRIFCEGIVVAK